MAAAPIILLPPSEGKAPGGSGPPVAPGTLRCPELDADRRRVAVALRSAMRGSAAACGKLLGVKGDALAAARAANRDVLDAPTLPAIERYTGVLYGELDHASLPARSRRRAEEQLLILSGLWGVVGPSDPIPDYKLKMGATVGPLGRLSTWWRPRLTAALAAVVEGRVVWDLLPNEHAAAWDPTAVAATRLISVTFLDDTGRGVDRKVTAVSHWNKLLEGALVRHVLATQLADPAGLSDFEHPLGYRYDPERTEETAGRVRVALVSRRP